MPSNSDKVSDANLSDVFAAEVSVKVSNNVDVPSCDNCTSYYLRFVSCLKPKYQFNMYHRTGEMDYCPAYFGDWGHCVRAKLSSDANVREVTMMKTKTYEQTIKQKSRKAPWKNKEQSQW